MGPEPGKVGNPGIAGGIGGVGGEGVHGGVLVVVYGLLGGIMDGGLRDGTGVLHGFVLGGGGSNGDLEGLGVGEVNGEGLGECPLDGDGEGLVGGDSGRLGEGNILGDDRGDVGADGEAVLKSDKKLEGEGADNMLGLGGLILPEGLAEKVESDEGGLIMAEGDNDPVLNGLEYALLDRMGDGVVNAEVKVFGIVNAPLYAAVIAMLGGWAATGFPIFAKSILIGSLPATLAL